MLSITFEAQLKLTQASESIFTTAQFNEQATPLEYLKQTATPLPYNPNSVRFCC